MGTAAPSGDQSGPAGANPSPSPLLPQAPPPQATGLASLDFELSQRGRLYSLVAPRGETEITARALPDETLNRLFRLALAFGAAAVILFFVRLARRAQTPWLPTAPTAVLWICLGALAVLSGVLPLLGLALIGAGLAAAIRRATRRTA